MTLTTDSIHEAMDELRDVRAARKHIESSTALLAQREQELRDEIMQGLLESGANNLTHAGLKVVRRTRDEVVIDDEIALKAIIKNSGRLADFSNLDKRKAGKWAHEIGSTLVHLETRESLVVSEVK